MKDFFISYSAKDTAWAEWIAWEVHRRGYDLIMQRWDFRPGSNFVVGMHAAIQECRRVILILSHNSLDSEFVTSEWSAYFSKDPTGKKRLILPVRVDDCIPDGLLGQIVYIDLCGLSKISAHLRLVEGIGDEAEAEAPVFPGVANYKTVTGPDFPADKGTSEHWQSNTHPLNEYLSSVKAHKLPSLRKRVLGRAFVESHLDYLIENLLLSEHRPVAITIDVDGMSNINSKFGIDVGDLVIDRLFAFAEALRGSYLVARIGDDTLLSVIVNTDEKRGCESARRLIKKVSDLDWTDIAQNLFVHCSSGVAAFHNREPGFNTVLRALSGQRSAREAGGNRAARGPEFVPEPKATERHARGPGRYRRRLPDS